MSKHGLCFFNISSLTLSDLGVHSCHSTKNHSSQNKKEKSRQYNCTMQTLTKSLARSTTSTKQQSLLQLVVTQSST